MLAGQRKWYCCFEKESWMDGGVGSCMRVRERCRGIFRIVSTYGRCIEYDTGAMYGHWLRNVFPMVNRAIKTLRDNMNISMRSSSPPCSTSLASIPNGQAQPAEPLQLHLELATTGYKASIPDLTRHSDQPDSL
jgi:hypothetical protein